ncbi:MAG: hypothetical protein [Caudoviricetes sp.]|nr:MAG: hypothetical protein [Caudoviricetes sp.]
MRKQLVSLVSDALVHQSISYNRGHENQGASIDVLSEVKRILSASGLSRNKNAQSVLTEIVDFDTTNNEALKYAKALSFTTRGFIKNEIKKLIK